MTEPTELTDLSEHPTGVTALIAVGSNLGDRLENLRSGVDGVDAIDGVDVTAVSELYETAPVGGPDDQGAYLNAAMRVTTTLDAATLLAELHQVEAGRARRRSVRWGPRTLDLDLLVHGATVSGTRRLHVPHPRMHERRFVMVPVCDVAPDLVHPLFGRTMADLLADLPVEPGDLTSIAAVWTPQSEGAPT